MVTLENDQLKISVDTKGAELKSVYHKQVGLDYLWNGDPAFWSKTSPVLFPIVGALKGGQYQYKGKSYSLSRHGFARDKTFTVVEQTDNSATFSLSSSEDTLAVYPFPFSFSITYTLESDFLVVAYQVHNTGIDEMLFSLGAHPAFKLPLVDGTVYQDYVLRFNREETAGRWPISKEGLIEETPEPVLQATTDLRLTKELFQKDALVLKQLQSDSVLLVSEKTPHGLQFFFAGFPFLGLWAAPGADFLCIEPWCGIADSVNASGALSEKEGIRTLAPAQTFAVGWRARFF